MVYKSTNPNVFTDGSKIISINGNPTISMEYDAIKKRLASAAWPLVLGLEMPVKPDQVSKWVGGWVSNWVGE